MYDVIVIGAGPAGSTAAKVLADKGLHIVPHRRWRWCRPGLPRRMLPPAPSASYQRNSARRVLLVERHKLPRYKSCSGVLIQKSMDLVRRYYGQDVPLSATCTRRTEP